MVGLLSGPVDLFGLVYFSNARRRYDDAALLDLLRVARRNNQRDQITGMLLYHDGNFVQALEGAQVDVQRVFNRIREDVAHDGVISTPLIPIDARQFPDWRMGFLVSGALSADARREIDNFLSDPRGSDDQISISAAWKL